MGATFHCSAHPARAELYLEFNSTTAAPGGVEFSYTASTTSRTALVQGDYFTLYDFRGYIAGSAFAPTDWSIEVQAVGVTPPGVNPGALSGDSASVVNLTFRYTGAARINGPISPIGGIGAFGAVSIWSSSELGCLTSRTHRNNPGKPDDDLPVPELDYAVVPAATVVQSLTVAPSIVAGGRPATGTVTLDQPAPGGGAEIALSSSNRQVATVPTSVTVDEGETTAAFAIATKGVSSTTTVTISATYSGVKRSATLRVRPVGVASLVLNPTTVQGGHDSVATVTLEAAARPTAVTVSLSSSSASAHFVDAGGNAISSVIVPLGQKTVSVTVRTVAVSATQSATLKATANGIAKSAVLKITP